MMSTSKRDPANEKLDEKLYTWDKSWVRPFESPLSAYINFCEINALTFSDILGYWGGNPGNASFFSNRLNCTICAPRSFEQTVIDNLLPDDYQHFPIIAGDIRYKRLFCYCPECIKQGYHTLLSQLPTENTCPIHKIPYIKLDKGLCMGNGGNYDIYYDSIGKFPLPPEREDIDYDLIAERAEEYNNIEHISYIFTSVKEDDLIVKPQYASNKTLISRIDPVFFNREDFVESVWNYFDRNAEIVYRDINDEDGDNIRISEGLRCALKERHYSPDSYLTRLMIMACMYDFIKDVDTSEYPGSFPNISEPRQNEVAATLPNIKASYCRAVRGSYMYCLIFDHSFITSPGGGAADNVIYNDTVFLDRIDAKISRIHAGYDRYDDKLSPYALSLDIAVSTIITHDHFWYQAREYISDALRGQTFDFVKEYSNLSPLLYEVVKESNGCISIYRMAA